MILKIIPSLIFLFFLLWLIFGTIFFIAIYNSKNNFTVIQQFLISSIFGLIMNFVVGFSGFIVYNFTHKYSNQENNGYVQIE